MPRSWRCGFLAIAATTAACSETAPPEPEVASIELSIADTGTTIRFRDPLIVRALPQAALGVPLERDVTWASVTPSLLTVEPLAPRGDSARVRASAVGVGEVRVSAGGVSRSFQVTVLDTVFSVVINPGALSLVAGDTVSFTATVAGSPNAEKALRWDVTNATVLQTFPPLDSLLRVRVRTAGAASVRAIAVADTTKVATATVTAQVGKLAFVTQPSTTFPRAGFNPVVRVGVEDANGVVSTRSTSAITLSVASGGCAGTLSGALTVTATNGVAVFPGVAANVRCPAVTLAAAAAPAATSAISQTFSVIERGCDVVLPVSRDDAVNALLESADCVVMRAGMPFYAHRYTVTVPDSSSTPVFRIYTQADGFTPRLESSLWPQDTAVYWADTLGAGGENLRSYALKAGTYRFLVTSKATGATGPYSIATGALAGSTRASCVILTMPGVSFESTFASGCTYFFLSRSGTSQGRRVLLFLPAGKAVQVTLQKVGGGTEDPYLEAFDVTDGPGRLIHFDNNSGGGPNSTDAQLTVTAATTGRFVEIFAARISGGLTSFRLTISP